MIYLALETNRIEALYFKKSLLGQYDINFFNKSFHLEFIKEGRVANVDVLASAVKEILTHLTVNGGKDKEAVLILPQSSFLFFRAEIPQDIAPSALDSFIRDKARAQLKVNLDDYSFDYFSLQNGKQKEVNVYAIAADVLSAYLETFKLLEIKIDSILPETIAYFKLFEKTLRSDKTENILYADYAGDNISAYFYDSRGLTDEKKIHHKLDAENSVEDFLKQKATSFEAAGKKINRLILSGEASESVRQDTFTKKTGMWTNPLKRIISNFYQEYLKLLVTPKNEGFSILNYDSCFGAFIFGNENRNFNLLKAKSAARNRNSGTPLKLPAIKKEVVIFAVSFIGSFLLFTLISRMNLPLSNFNPVKNLVARNSPTPTPSPVPPTSTPTPTPAFTRADLNVKILNGGGVRGKAAEVKTIMSEAGYENIVTANADSFDYNNTVIQVKKSKSQAAVMIKSDLAENTSTIKEEVLDEKEKADVVVIIGKDFK